MSPWPEAYGGYDEFMIASEARFVRDMHKELPFFEKRLAMVEARIERLMEYHGVRGCDAFDEVEWRRFVPNSGVSSRQGRRCYEKTDNTMKSHIMKQGIQTGELNGEKLFAATLRGVWTLV